MKSHSPSDWASRSHVFSPVSAEDIAKAQRLMAMSQGLVRSIAWKIHQKLPPHVQLDDLIAEGQVGLAQAARDFDESRGGQFSTYAYYRIRGAILDSLSKMTWFNLHHYHSSRYEAMADELMKQESESGAEPSGVESGTRWLRGVASTLAVVYLGTGSDRDDESRSPALVDESTPSPPAEASLRELRKVIHELIEALPSDAGVLLRAVYFEGLSIKEAGERLGISKAWASRLHAKTLQRLARSLELLGAGD